MDLPTVIALLAPVALLPILDQIIQRVLARRRPRPDAAEVPSPETVAPSEMPITSHHSAPATDRTVARHVA